MKKSSLHGCYLFSLLALLSPFGVLAQQSKETARSSGTEMKERKTTNFSIVTLVCTIKQCDRKRYKSRTGSESKPECDSDDYDSITRRPIDPRVIQTHDGTVTVRVTSSIFEEDYSTEEKLSKKFTRYYKKRNRVDRYSGELVVTSKVTDVDDSGYRTENTLFKKGICVNEKALQKKY